MTFKWPCGSQKAHKCDHNWSKPFWAISDDIKTAIWLNLVTKGTTLYTWPKGNCGTQKAHIGIQKCPIYYLGINTDRLTLIWISANTKGNHFHHFEAQIQAKSFFSAKNAKDYLDWRCSHLRGIWTNP